MPTPAAPVTFRLDDIAAGHRAFDSLSRQLACRRNGVDRRETTYYDTFDWRAYRHGWILGSRFQGRTKLLSCLELDGREQYRCPLDTRPGFVADLPNGTLRTAVEDVLEMRRLLPLFTIETESDTLHLLDRRRKTVARVSLERSRVHPARGERLSCELPAVLRAVPLRGFDREFTTLLQALDALDLQPIERSVFLLAADLAGLVPGDYTSRLDLHLDPEMRSDEALRLILHRLLEVMRANQWGLRENLDSEFLHDFRVAVRRTRSALGQLTGVLPATEVDRFKTDFSWLGQITGPTRDLDVYQLELAAERLRLPESLQTDLGPLDEFVERHRHLEHREMTQMMQTRRFEKLLIDWEQFLDHSFAEATDRPDAATPILALASERIWRRYRKIVKRGGAIGPESPASSFHRLRIHCKKLRYLLEFFRSLFPSDRITPLIQSLKHLQDNLGTYNDLEVQQAMLERFAQAMQVEEVATPQSLLAMGRLTERLEQRQLDEKQAFHKRFRRFSNRQNRQTFEELFRPVGTPHS